METEGRSVQNVVGSALSVISSLLTFWSDRRVRKKELLAAKHEGEAEKGLGSLTGNGLSSSGVGGEGTDSLSCIPCPKCYQL